MKSFTILVVAFFTPVIVALAINAPTFQAQAVSPRDTQPGSSRVEPEALIADPMVEQMVQVQTAKVAAANEASERLNKLNREAEERVARLEVQKRKSQARIDKLEQEIAQRGRELRSNYSRVQRRMSSLMKQAKDLDRREKLKHEELRSDRSRIGDQYVDGIYSAAVWRKKLAAFDKSKARIELYWDDETEALKSKMTKLASEKESLRREASQLGISIQN